MKNDIEEKEVRERERFLEYINYYLQKANIEQLKMLFFFSKKFIG